MSSYLPSNISPNYDKNISETEEQSRTHIFEFPRQKEASVIDPEVMNFKTSEELLNPNVSNEVFLPLQELIDIFRTDGGRSRKNWRSQILSKLGFVHYISSSTVLQSLLSIETKVNKAKIRIKAEHRQQHPILIGDANKWAMQYKHEQNQCSISEASVTIMGNDSVNEDLESFLPQYGPHISLEKHNDLLIETWKEFPKRIARQRKYYQNQIAKAVKDNCGEIGKKLIEQLQKQVQKLRKANNQKKNKLNKKGLSASPKSAARVTVMEEFVIPKKKRKIEVQLNKKEFDQEFKHLCVYLSWRFISDAGVVYALAAITKYLNIDIRIPNRRTVGRWCEEAIALTRIQIDEWFDENAKNLTIHTDETTLSSEKLQAQIFCKSVDGKKSYMVTGIPRVADKGAATSLKSMLDSLRKSIKPLEALSNDEIEEILQKRIGAIVNSVSDRASTQKLFNNLLSAETNNNINELFCGHHILASIYDVFLKSCVIDEREKFDDPQLKDPKMKRAIEIISTSFSPRSNHPTSKAAEWLKYAEENDVDFPIFPSKIGSRWNVGPSICAALLHNREKFLEFMTTTKYAVDETFAPLMKVLQCPALVAQLHLGASIDTFLTGPWWTVIDKSEHIEELAAANFRLIQYCKNVAENERVYCVESLIPLQTERSPRQDAIRHTVTAKIFDGCYEIVPLFYNNIAEYLKKQMMLVLPEGENMDENLKDQLASASGTNKIAEQVFGIAAFLRRLSCGKSTERITSNVIVVKNGTVDWFESKNPEEKKAIIKAMKERRAAQRLQLKNDKKQLQEELAKKYKENQAKQQKKKVKTVEIDFDQYIGSRFHERWDEQADLWMYGYIQKKDKEGYIVQFYGDEEPVVYPSEYLKYQYLCDNIIFRD